MVCYVQRDGKKILEKCFYVNWENSMRTKWYSWPKVIHAAETRAMKFPPWRHFNLDVCSTKSFLAISNVFQSFFGMCIIKEIMQTLQLWQLHTHCFVYRSKSQDVCQTLLWCNHVNWNLEKQQSFRYIEYIYKSLHHQAIPQTFFKKPLRWLLRKTTAFDFVANEQASYLTLSSVSRNLRHSWLVNPGGNRFLPRTIHLFETARLSRAGFSGLALKHPRFPRSLQGQACLEACGSWSSCSRRSRTRAWRCTSSERNTGYWTKGLCSRPLLPRCAPTCQSATWLWCHIGIQLSRLRCTSERERRTTRRGNSGRRRAVERRGGILAR